MAVEPGVGGQKRWIAAVFGLSCAAPLLVFLRGFTVDDALVTARVAHHIASGHGHRFNSDGPVVDAVTPLGFEYLLSPFAGNGPWEAFLAAKILGGLCWLLAAAAVGVRIADLGGGRARFLPLSLFLVNVPLAAWAASGMETGLITALCTAALWPGVSAAACVGLAAALRPELLGWALIWAALSPAAGRRQRALRLLCVALLPALWVLLRWTLFGRSFPLAVLAKPSDLAHGAYYALNAFVYTGAPLLVLAPIALWRRRGLPAALALAALAHFVSLVLAGGDWMPLFRLAVPILPGLVYVGAALMASAARWACALRVASALVASSILAFSHAAVAARVGEHREGLIRAARPLLEGSQRVAGLDAGWLGVATPETVIEFAGITDPNVAVLSGGHASKRIGSGFLRARDVDTVVLLLAAGQSPRAPLDARLYDRPVEQRVAYFAEQEGYRIVATLPLGGTDKTYLVLRR